MLNFFIGVWITGFLYEYLSYLEFELKNSRYNKADEWFKQMYAQFDTSVFWSMVFVFVAALFFLLWPLALARRISKV